MRAISRSSRSRAVLVLLAALALVLVAAGCGGDEKRTSGNEGDYINAGDALYQVQLSRLLSPGQRPDDDYLQGQPTVPSKEQYLAVFMTLENEGKSAYRPPQDMKLIDTQGNQYLPIVTSGGGFALNFFDDIPPGHTAPPPDSPAAAGPEGGAMVLFKLSIESARDNLPLHLEIPAGGDKQSSIRLDI